MKYVVTTEDRGLTLKPDAVWNGGIYFPFEVIGMSNSDYAKENSKKSASGWSNFLNWEVKSFISKLMPIIALSVIEAEPFPAVMFNQDMLFVMRIINSIVLKVKLLMELEINNKAAKDMTHNCSVGRILRNVEVKNIS